jgi:RNA polymerase sigma-70 factor, ECF subfamily
VAATIVWSTLVKPVSKRAEFEALALPHLRSAYNLARWMTRNREDAEDVAQDALVRAFAAFHTFRGGDMKPWLLTIVRNTCMTWLKRNRTESLPLDDQLPPVDPAQDPEERLLASADRAQVRSALEKLPPEFREAIVLREMEDLSYKEIAEVAGVPIGTVMSRLARARDAMRRILSERKPA